MAIEESVFRYPYGFKTQMARDAAAAVRVVRCVIHTREKAEPNKYAGLDPSHLRGRKSKRQYALLCSAWHLIPDYLRNRFVRAYLDASYEADKSSAARHQNWQSLCLEISQLAIILVREAGLFLAMGRDRLAYQQAELDR